MVDKQTFEAIRNTCVKYNLHQYIPAVQKVFDLNERNEDTETHYRIMLLKLEGRVRGVPPEDLNLLIEHQGQSNARLIIKELNDILNQKEENASK